MDAAIPSWFFLTTYTILGLLIGSFLNVVVARVPAKESINTRSRCPKCGHQIRAYDNIPVLSWLILKGRCRDCKTRISQRYPFVELGVGVGFLALAAHFHMRIPTALDITLLTAFAFTVALALIDVDTKRLPDVLTLPLSGVMVVGLTAQAAFADQWGNYVTALICGAAYGIFYFLLFFLTGGRGLGFGDVKLSPALGLLTGWFGIGSTATGFMAAFLLSGIPLGILLLTGILKRGTHVPFGPFLIAGAWIGVVWGVSLTTLYLSVSGL